MNQEETRRLLEEVSERWLADPRAGVIGAGDHEGRRGLRLRLGTGEPSTVWFQVGERTLRVEAFILPPRRAPGGGLPAQPGPQHGGAAPAPGARPPRRAGGGGRVPRSEVDADELELLLGEAHEALEVVRPTLAPVAFEREKNP